MSVLFTPQDALCAAMIVTACADDDLNARESDTVRAMIALLPVFEGFEAHRFDEIKAIVGGMLDDEDGIDQLLDLLEQELSQLQAETAYALCCDVAAADGHLTQEELELLEMIADRLGVDTLIRGAIQRATRARWSRS